MMAVSSVNMSPKSWISRSRSSGNNFYSSFFIITCVVIILFPCLNAFRVFVLVPQSVERGHDAILACYTPDLEDHELYRITWLKDGERLYRFKINHPRDRETFHVPGVQIDPLASNLTHLYVKQADISAEGIYACEVETRGPSFRMARNASLLRMFSVPGDFKTVVKISTDDPNGRGDLECTSAPTHPEVKLTWYINGEPAAWNRVTNYPVETTRENLKISKSRLSYVPDDSETSYSCEGLIKFNKFLLKATSQLKVPGSHAGPFPPETFTHETLDDFNQREREFESGNAVISEPFKEDKNQRKRLRSAGNPSFSQVGLASLLLNLVFYCILH